MNFVKLFAFAIFTTVFFVESNAQSELMLKNSNIEGVSPEGKFWWWNNSAKNGADATFCIEDFDTNPASEKALKIETHKLGENGWFLSTQYNQKFKGKDGEKVTVIFHAKEVDGNGKIKLVLQNDIKGSFQGKDFMLSKDWNSYTHTFTVKGKSQNNQIKFWYMTEGATFLLDDIKILK